MIFTIYYILPCYFSGPLTTNYEGKDVLVGVSSFVYFGLCSIAGHPSIFARVDTELEWIKENSDAKDYSCF
jgi:hypothetical protein